MRITPREAWIIARLLCGRATAPDGMVEPLPESERIAALADRLREAEPSQRLSVWKGFLAGRSDAEDWTIPVGEADPTAVPPSAPERGGESFATLADVRRLISETAWTWPGWLAGGVLNTLASNPGEGKTILAMNLARILWEGRAWPDGAANPLPAGTRTLWVPGDRHYPQLIELADRYGLPDDAMHFNARADEPADGYDLDDPATLDALMEAVFHIKPGLVIVDTVGMTTRRNLGRPEEAREYFGPLMDIAGASRVPFLLITHLSRDSQALGRRIVGASRLVWKLTKPDPDGQPDRRRFWVDKSYALVPNPLGITITADGCDFDEAPPDESGGKMPRSEEVKQWLRDQLADGPAPLVRILAEGKERGYGVCSLYRARTGIGAEESGTYRKKMWRLPVEMEPLLFDGFDS